MPITLGFSKEKEVVRNVALKKEAPSKEALAREIYAREYIKELKRRQTQKARKELGLEDSGKRYRQGFSKFRKELSNIGNQVRSERPEFRQRREMVQDRPMIQNFFEHKDEMEVYGDEGLTFFDSNKNRGQGRTGNLFGF